MRYWIIIALGFPGSIAEAQQMEGAFAEKLLNKEIAFFVSRSDSEKTALLMDKADLYNLHQDYAKALSELERAGRFSAFENSQLKYKKMLNYFLSNQFSNCAAIAVPQSELRSMGKEKEYFAMRFFSLNETEQWAQCKEELLDYCLLCDSAHRIEIACLNIHYDYISPEKCKRLSSFVPGLGMAEAGKPFKGTTSFLLQTGMVLGIAYGFYSGYYIAGVVSGIFPLMKFHSGGGRLSAALAEERNERGKRTLKETYTREIKKALR
jgi:hypothetical protein